jgi:hypothetical protein
MTVNEVYEEIRSGVDDGRLRDILDELWEDADDAGASRAHFDV